MTGGKDITERAESDVAEAARQTLANYEARARDFWEGTRDHDVSQNVEALLEAIETPPPFTLLDLGCGPGRDLRTFVERGHRAIGVDGTPSFVAMARAYSACEVWQQDFLALDLPASFFDGIFANASLFHVPRQELPRVLGELFHALRPGGVLFSSNPRGANEEGWNLGRYGVWHDLDGWSAFVTAAGFLPIRNYFRPPGLPLAQQPWLASLWRRPPA